MILSSGDFGLQGFSFGDIMDLITINIPVPNVIDETILEVIGAGLNILLDQHKKLGTSFNDVFLTEHVRLTMGDHICELVGGSDEVFNHVYETSVSLLETVLAVEWDRLEAFATQVTTIADIMVFWYPELIRLCIKEGGTLATGYSDLYISLAQN